MLEFLFRALKKSVFFLTILVFFTENPRIIANCEIKRQWIMFKGQLRCFPVPICAVYPKTVLRIPYLALKGSFESMEVENLLKNAKF